MAVMVHTLVDGGRVAFAMWVGRGVEKPDGLTCAGVESVFGAGTVDGRTECR